MAPDEAQYAVVQTPRASGREPSQAAAKLLPLSELFLYADTTDKWLMAVGSLGSIAAGVMQPIQILLLGDMLNAFNPADPLDTSAMTNAINRVALNFVFVGVAVLFCGLAQVACWSITASRQTRRIRSAFVAAVLAKEIAWFDVSDPMQLPARLADSIVAIQSGLGRKIGEGLHFTSMAVSGILIGLIKGWELALVLLAFTPAIAIMASMAVKVLATATQASIDSYGNAGAVAHESLSNVRTVHMLNAVDHFVSKYRAALDLSTAAGIKKGLAVGWGTGATFFVMFCMYACGLFFGAVKVANDRLDGNTCTGSGCYDGGRVLTVFFSVLMGAMALGQAGPSAEAVFSARTAAFDVFAVIKRDSRINPMDDSGKVLACVAGAITISNVTFAYPSRPEVNVCNNYSLAIRAGETVALVGPSGSGKSTIVSLLERFYDPLNGSVQLDGHDVRNLNVRWLRQQIGLVSQEPTLFSTSILENIRYGSPGASDQDVYQAAKMANAFEFIMDFPQGFATEVGGRGAQLSGGQKQRIAIARAIIKNPPILLLDEATSALDSESERIVQASLDDLLATSIRTTIIVAHRLSTIRNADRIAVHSDGSIVEIGSHEELMSIPDSCYRKLIEASSGPCTNDSNKGDASVHCRFSSDEVGSIELKSRISRMKQPDTLTKATEAGSDEPPSVSAARIWNMSKPEWTFMCMGAIGAVVNAAVFPVWGLLITKLTVLFFEYSKTKHEMLTDARYWSLDFVCLGAVFGLSIMMQHYGFAVAGQKLVSRVRLAAFSAMLQQEVGWFDLSENSSGALVTRLATDSAMLQALTSDMLNHTLVNVISLGIAFGIAFYYSWKMTLALLATSPLMICASYAQMAQLRGDSESEQVSDADAAAGALLSEAINSIRTVVSFSLETVMSATYQRFLDVSKSADLKSGLVGGGAFGFSLSIQFFNIAFLFWLGGKWTADGSVTFEDFFMVLMVIMQSMFAGALTSQGAADGANARQAGGRIFKIIDRAPEIDATSSVGSPAERLVGDIEFSHVEFAYPSRPDTKVYENYNLKIARGQTVALVGASGSGKSTAISLLERFYDPSAGVVTLDGTDIRQLNVRWLRERISLVSQEPV